MRYGINTNITKCLKITDSVSSILELKEKHVICEVKYNFYPFKTYFMAPVAFNRYSYVTLTINAMEILARSLLKVKNKLTTTVYLRLHCRILNFSHLCCFM